MSVPVAGTELRLQRATAAWSEWVAQADPAVLATITNVQLNNYGGGYVVHIACWDADQKVVDRIASALGCSSNEGWEPESDRSDRQWSLNLERDGLDWHVTAITPQKED